MIGWMSTAVAEQVRKIKKLAARRLERLGRDWAEYDFYRPALQASRPQSPEMKAAVERWKAGR